MIFVAYFSLRAFSMLGGMERLVYVHPGTILQDVSDGQFNLKKFENFFVAYGWRGFA